jgi:hypothetical protein
LVFLCLAEVNSLSNWLERRMAWMDGAFEAERGAGLQVVAASGG